MESNPYPISPGGIHQATVQYALRTGEAVTQKQRVLLLDVSPADPDQQMKIKADELNTPPSGRYDGPWITVLWQQVSDDGTPTDRPRREELTAIQDTRDSDSRAVTLLHLGARLGTYQPRDSGTNSVEILRDQAVVQLDRAERWAEQYHPQDLAAAAADVLGASELEAEAIRRRDELIRRRVAEGVPVRSVAPATGLGTERIYQIRDRRR